MGFCLSHISALEYWRSLDAFESARILELGVTARTVAPSPAQGGIVSAAGVADEVFSTGGPLPRPYHVLVPSKKLCRCSSIAAFHVQSRPFPRGSFYRISRDCFVVSPEVAFVQCAVGLSFVDLLKVGTELAGTYSVNREFDALWQMDERGFSRRSALLRLCDLRSFLSGVSYMHGSKKAKRALRYIPEGCASPMEAALALLLHLPCALGGYGLPKPQMNYRIDMRDRSAEVSAKPYYVCDLYWPDANLCVEYDSDMFHTGSQRIADDSSRRNALAFRGVFVVSITRRQLSSCTEMDRTARLLAKRLGVRLRAFGPEFRQRQRRLRAQLLPWRG